MKLQTRDFGEIEIEDGALLTFAGPIYGFEEYRTFVLIQDESVGPQFAWLQSAEEPELCFVLTDAGLLNDYRPSLTPELQTLLGGKEADFWLVTVLGDSLASSTVNLRSPIAVNAQTRRAAQAVLDDSLPVRHRLALPKEESTC